MEIDTYTFILAVAAFGLVVVFLLLLVASALMSLFRRVDALVPEKLPGGDQALRRIVVSDRAAPARASAGGEASGQLDWVTAAVVAYLELEMADTLPDTAGWIGNRSHSGDPWLSGLVGERR